MHLPPRIQTAAMITPHRAPVGYPGAAAVPAMIQPLGHQAGELSIVRGPQPPPRYVTMLPPAFPAEVGAPPVTVGGSQPAPKVLCELCQNPGGRKRRKGAHRGSVICDTCNVDKVATPRRATHFEPTPEGIFFADIEWPEEPEPPMFRTTGGPAAPDPANPRAFVLNAVCCSAVLAGTTTLVAIKAAQQLKAPPAVTYAANALLAKARTLI